MRVTNKMLSNNFLRDMKTNLNNMNTLQGQLTSGKQIKKASDDPFKASRIMQMYAEIDANKQYKTNIKDTISRLDTTDTALGQAGNVVGRVEELLIAAGNAAYGSDERRAIKDEINEKVAEFSQILNTSFDGKYIFGGSRGTTKPLDAVKATAPSNPLNTQLVYNINPLDPTAIDQENMLKEKLLVEVSQGVTMEYNVTSVEVIKYGTVGVPAADYPGDIRGLLKNITDHLDNPADTLKLTNSDLTGIKDAMTNILKLRAEVGAKQNRMESSESRNVDSNFNMTEMLSRMEDIDVTEKAMEYSTMQTVYVAALQTSARVLQPSLLDYLR